MKKYSSYADLKITPSTKLIPSEYIPYKMMITPSSRKPYEAPYMMISKENFGVPMTAKYSAGYLQRKKMFSSKKENRDEYNIKANYQENHRAEKNNASHRVVENQKERTSKNKKIPDDRDKNMKKDKFIRLDKPLQIDSKGNIDYKPTRFDVQSPKGMVGPLKDDIREEKSKSRIKEKDKSQKYIVLYNNEKSKEKKNKEEDELNDYVTKYEPDNKNMLIHCTSDSTLLKNKTIPEKKSVKGYYRSVVCDSLLSNKGSSFSQLCRNHLVTSIEFLTFAKKNKQIIPSTFTKCNFPNSNRKIIIFDLDETLIHCNESLDIAHDVALEIVFPNNHKIKAGINIRPYAVECLKELSKYFEIIVFTASHECYANVIIDYLDPKREYVSHRFFRESCYKTQEGFYVKDLRIFGRDLSNLLLIDNVLFYLTKAAYSYCFQPENGVPIVPFYDNKADLELKEVTSYLKEFKDCKNMRAKNEGYMKLSEYHRFNCPKKLINELYM